METFIIDYKEVKKLMESKEIPAIGSNIYQVNNQSEYTINEERTKIWKRRHTASKAIYDLIASK